MKEKKPKSSTKYICVSCEVYDSLELLALRKTEVWLEFNDLDGNVIRERHTIEDLITKEKEEYLISTSGLRLRLDKILNINEIAGI
ncbi:MAG: hypothetical protein AAGK97_15940 [Bacteroidota bacterium]